TANVAACAVPYENDRALQAEKVLLERELEGLRESAAILKRGEALFPASDVVVAIDEALVQGLIAASLPLEITAAPYRIQLTAAEVVFSGAPTVQLRGTVTRDGLTEISVSLGLIGALSKIEIDTKTFTLRARIAADHLEIEQVAGIGSFLSGSSLEDVAQLIRSQIEAQLPIVEIPVRVQQDINIPSVTDGPVQVTAARFPVKVMVSRVFAANRRLWISLHVAVGLAGKVTP
ncbi:MAG: hypothetical protein ABIP90_01460, partial [Vicinamibacterales bacterium]